MFKDKLKDLRRSKNLSQQELADIIFVSRSAVAKWENGIGLPSDTYLKAICEYFNVEEDYLIDKSELKQIVDYTYHEQMNLKIMFFVLITIFVFLPCLVFFGGLSYWLHRVAILLTIIYFVFKLFLPKTKLNKIFIVVVLSLDLILSLLNWVITAIPEPSHLFRVAILFKQFGYLNLNLLNLILSQLSSIINIFVIVCVNVLLIILNRKKNID